MALVLAVFVFHIHQQQMFLLITLSLLLFYGVFIFWFKRTKFCQHRDFLCQSLRDISSPRNTIISSLFLGGVVCSVLYVLFKTYWKFQYEIVVSEFQYGHPKQSMAPLKTLMQWYHEKSQFLSIKLSHLYHEQMFILITLSLLFFYGFFLFWFKITKFCQYKDFLCHSLRDLSSPRYMIISSLFLGGVVCVALFKTYWKLQYEIVVFEFQYGHPKQSMTPLKTLMQWYQEKPQFLFITLSLIFFSIFCLFWFKRTLCQLVTKLQVIGTSYQLGELLHKKLRRDLSHNKYGPYIPLKDTVICSILFSLCVGVVVFNVLYMLFKACWKFHFTIILFGFKYDHQEQSETNLFLIITLPLLLFSVFFLLWIKRTSGKLPPSPPKLPIIGNFHQLGEVLHSSLRDFSNKYGPLMFLRIGSVPTLVVSSPKMANEITKSHDLVFANRPITSCAKALLYGCTAADFATNDEYWRDIRENCVMELLSTKRVEFYKSIRAKEVEVFIKKITSSCSTNEPINLTDMLLNLADNLISKVVFGKSYVGEDGTSKLGNLTRDVFTLMGEFSVTGFFPWLGWIDSLTGLDERTKKKFSAMDEFFDQVIEDHVKTKKGDADVKDLVDILLQAQKDETLNVPIIRENIKAIILDMFLSGTNSVSIVIEWAMVELMRNPDMLKKAQEEVLRVEKNKYHCDNCRRGVQPQVTEEDIKQMDFVKCIIKEVLRLHPPVPLLVPRESTEICNIEGYTIPTKTIVFINAWAIQRDPKSWKDPEDFFPERFMNNPIDSTGSNSQYLPFGAGKRGCPGMYFGLIASELVLAHLLFWFEWELPAGSSKEDLDMSEAFGRIVYKQNPTYLVPKARNVSS